VKKNIGLRGRIADLKGGFLKFSQLFVLVGVTEFNYF
jgi:hypothetical protein